ncbi:MAG: 5'/3'-nucleotidase SurE [Chloroflexi bacterium]|nr:5'/3'-nucleotidase SurE [Chloroflexota bacterium]
MILVTNDDGIDSEGLAALNQAVEALGPTVVLAPNRNWTASGHTKTLDRPLRVVPVKLTDGTPGYACDGAPSDCVALAMLGYLDEKPDLVVAGINKGPNLGGDVTYSGTLAAAMEGVVFGVPSIAISLCDYYEWDFTYAAQFAGQLVADCLRTGLDGDVLLNVNVPSLPADRIRGLQVTKLGKRIYASRLLKRQDPFGKDYYWFAGDEPTGAHDEGTDILAVHEGYVSVTPILMDLTDHGLIEKVRSWVLRL